MKKKSLVMALISASVIAGCFTGCGEKAPVVGENGKAELSWWVRLYPHVAQTATSFSEVELYKKLSENTGVELSFIHPAIGQEKESFNIMIASGELPDLITYDFSTYKGGAKKAIDDGVIIELDPYLDKATNYKKVLDNNPDIDRQTTTDDGKHYCFANIGDGEYGGFWQGLQIRKDLLDKAGLPLPETIDDWDKTLRAFKNMGIEYPLTLTGVFQKGTFCGAFGIGEQYYLDDGKVKYGICQPEYKQYLELMHSWYSEGLLDPDFYSQDGKTFNSKITSGKAGAYFAPVGGGMGTYLPILKSVNENYDLSGTKFPVMNKGELPKYAIKSDDFIPSASTYITTACKNIDAALRLLDYGYSEEGHMLYNFGIEGISYNMVDGYPKYTDEMLHNSEGLSAQHALAKYMAAVYGGSFVSDSRYFEQYQAYDQQKEAVKLWAQQEEGHRMPPVHFTEEEANILSQKETTIYSYMSEKVLDFITGEVSLDKFDSFVAEVKNMGFDEVIAIYQAAVDRYNSK